VILRQLERIIRERSGQESGDAPDSAGPVSSSTVSDGRRPLDRGERVDTKLDVSRERR